MKFGMWVDVDEWCTTVCSVTRSKVKVKVTSPWKSEIRPFSKVISYPIYNGAGKWPRILKLGGVLCLIAHKNACVFVRPPKKAQNASRQYIDALTALQGRVDGVSVLFSSNGRRSAWRGGRRIARTSVQYRTRQVVLQAYLVCVSGGDRPMATIKLSGFRCVCRCRRR